MDNRRYSPAKIAMATAATCLLLKMLSRKKRASAFTLKTASAQFMTRGLKFAGFSLFSGIIRKASLLFMLI